MIHFKVIGTISPFKSGGEVAAQILAHDVMISWLDLLPGRQTNPTTQETNQPVSTVVLRGA